LQIAACPLGIEDCGFTVDWPQSAQFRDPQ
jgi:hypothetical protein